MALIPYSHVPGAQDAPLSVAGHELQEVYCGDPRCDCHTGHLVFAGMPFAVDLGTMRVDYAGQGAGQSPQAAQQLGEIRELLAQTVRGAGVIERLRAHYAAAREYGRDNHYKYLRWDSLKPGQMALWEEVHPAEQARSYTMAPAGTPEESQRHMLLRDGYCVDPRCDCHRMFFQVLQAGADRMARPLGRVLYDLKKREPSVQTVEPGIDPNQLFTYVYVIMRQPEFYQLYADRYAQIRREVGPLVLEKRRAQSARKSPVSTVGRNDPCPCGSGKKYKKCHGA